MMKLALAIVASAALAAPAVACPWHDHDQAPRTAQKDPQKAPAKAKDQPKAAKDTSKASAKDTAKAKPAPKKTGGDKVSIR